MHGRIRRQVLIRQTNRVMAAACMLGLKAAAANAVVGNKTRSI